ncbi:hypothetical protein GCM10023321_26110 [Pseudonocardia eucalypti]|uniref:Uncharacterized protein n=1 Tax=Pseudonocardia eucalypti TaxID=648755 RepID=A0ABP9Q091_9PSEU|nr:hypothetical protein [Pseudonocardia eucalypti]
MKILYFLYGKLLTVLALASLPLLAISLLSPIEDINVFGMYYYLAWLWFLCFLSIGYLSVGTYRLSLLGKRNRHGQHANYPLLRHGTFGLVTSLGALYLLALLVPATALAPDGTPWWQLPTWVLVTYITTPPSWLPWGPFLILVSRLII